MTSVLNFITDIPLQPLHVEKYFAIININRFYDKNSIDNEYE